MERERRQPKRLTLSELLDSMSEHERPGVVWRSPVKWLPESMQQLREAIIKSNVESTENEMTQEFIDMIGWYGDPDDIVRQLPFSEEQVNGQQTLYVHFIIPRDQSN